MKARGRGEPGNASLAQTVLVAPALLLALLLIVQFGLLFHARSVAENAAQEGAAAGRRFDGTQTGAVERARRFLAELGPRMLTDRTVTAQRTAETATVTVTGTVISLVPGLHLRVSEAASGPVERYVPSSSEFGDSELAAGGS
jgi:Flp pilus assembly protein TadG